MTETRECDWKWCMILKIGRKTEYDGRLKISIMNKGKNSHVQENNKINVKRNIRMKRKDGTGNGVRNYSSEGGLNNLADQTNVL